jgi:hypothetical protein
MRIKSFSRLARAPLYVFITACVARQPTSAPVPEPASTPQTTPAASPSAPGIHTTEGPWTFTYAPGTLTYNITVEARIARVPDSTNARVFPPATQQITLTLLPTGETQLVTPPAPTSSVCDSTAALATRASQLIPKLPTQLTAGATWSDTVIVEGCRGNIPAVTNIARRYTVVGDTTVGGTQLLHVVRTEAVVSRGEGNEGQHRVLMNATGTGTSSLFFDVTKGRFFGSSGTHTTDVGITTSGRVNHFLQHTTERVMLVPAQ